MGHADSWGMCMGPRVLEIGTSVGNPVGKRFWSSRSGWEILLISPFGLESRNFNFPEFVLLVNRCVVSEALFITVSTYFIRVYLAFLPLGRRGGLQAMLSNHQILMILMIILLYHNNQRLKEINGDNLVSRLFKCSSSQFEFIIITILLIII